MSLELLPPPGLSVDVGCMRLGLGAKLTGKVADQGILLSQFILEPGLGVGVGVDLRLKLDLGGGWVEGRHGGLGQAAVDGRRRLE